MTEFFCPFCGPDPRPTRSPCPQVRAMKFETDGTMSHFKIKGVKGWLHKSKMFHPFRGIADLAYVKNSVAPGGQTAAIIEAGE